MVDVSGRRFGWLWLLVLGALGTAVSIAVLKKLGYSTSWVSRTSAEVAAASPNAGSMVVGALEWNLNGLAHAPSLAPFRTEFSSCAGLAGGGPMTCVYDKLAARSPIGDPRVEFVDPGYDPSAALAEHLNGAPGHCTTRSALAATALLAIGVPARVVQIYPATANGHNVVEVFVEGEWRLFDPAFGDWFARPDGRFHSAASLQLDEGVKWAAHESGPDLAHYRFATVLYPEPWLYTRTGARQAVWPFRAVFARVGDRRADLGSLQKAAFFSALSFLSLGLLALAALISGARWPTLTASARPTGGAPTVEREDETPASAP